MADMKKTQERIDELMREALSKGKGGWKQVRARGDKILSQARDRGEDVWIEARRMIRRNPTKAVSAALGTGLLLGAALFLRAGKKRKSFF